MVLKYCLRWTRRIVQAVGFKVKFYWYQIGHGDFLHSFFSTVAYNLENGN
ncbi:MAG: Imm70 family immunity protein [Roseburia inulinivorans]